MAERAQFTPAQLAEIRDALITRRGITCPVCAGPMASDPVAGGSVGDGSLRIRVRVVCRDCRRSATVLLSARSAGAND